MSSQGVLPGEQTHNHPDLCPIEGQWLGPCSQIGSLPLCITGTSPQCQMLVLPPAFHLPTYILPRDPQKGLRPRSSVTEGPTSESCFTNSYDLTFHYWQQNYVCENSAKSAERNTISLDAQWYYKELVCFLLTSSTFQNVHTILPDCSVSPQKIVILKLSDDFVVKFQTTSKTSS